jgi:membrane protein
MELVGNAGFQYAARVAESTSQLKGRHAWAPVFEIVNFAVSFFIISALFALLVRLLPRTTIARGDVVIGAIVTALLFNIGKFVIGLYIVKSAITSSFGAAGSIIALVIWVYYSAQMFLLGAEFTWVYAKKFGSRSGLPRSLIP